MNVTIIHWNLCKTSQLHRRGTRMYGQPQIFVLDNYYFTLGNVLCFQRTDQKSQQVCKTSIEICILSRKNAGVGAKFQYNCRLQSSNITGSRILLIIFSKNPLVAYIYVYIYLYKCNQENNDPPIYHMALWQLTHLGT